jgi:hypothetical protein
MRLLGSIVPEVCLLGFGGVLGRRRWAAFLGLRRFASYPPPWLAAILATSLVFVSWRWLPDLRLALPLDNETVRTMFVMGAAGSASFFVCAIASAVALWICHCAARPISGFEPSQPESTATLASFEEIGEWAINDHPVELASADAFDHTRIALRIASRLAQPKPPAQAVVGRLGAGKTTLRHLVVEALRTGPRGKVVKLVPVELWPYETPRAAVAGVIGALVDALGREVNLLSLRGLPAAYAEAMSAAGGIWSVLARLQGIPSDPFASLKTIDRVAKAIGLQYVVWIDDLERFAGGASDEERLSPISALLYGLDQGDSVTVIAATTNLHVRFDIEKIARFVEHMPEIPEGRLRKILGLFRNGPSAEAGIDPAWPVERQKLGELNDDLDMKFIRDMVGTDVRDIADALTTLCATPRVLKKALRACLDTWRSLAGEIDLDHLLALSILREAQPDAFALVDGHLHFLRGSPAKDEMPKAEASWKAALAALNLDARTRDAVRHVIEFVFSGDEANHRPQGVWHRSHADYWDRFLTVPNLMENERDQVILRTMRESDDARLVDLIEDAGSSTAVEDFGHQLETSRLERLLVPLVERRSQELGGWLDNQPPGLIPLLRMWNRRTEQGELKGETVRRELERAFEHLHSHESGIDGDRGEPLCHVLRWRARSPSLPGGLLS